MTYIDDAVLPNRQRQTTRLARRMPALMLAALTAVAGCAGSDSSTSPEDESNGLAGVYSLSQANSSAIPAKLYHGPYYDDAIPHFWNQLIVTVTRGTVELDDDGRFALSLDLTFVADGETASTTVNGEGDYEVQGDQLHLTADAGAEYSARLQNGRLIIDLPSPLTKSNVKSHQYQFRK